MQLQRYDWEHGAPLRERQGWPVFQQALAWWACFCLEERPPAPAPLLQVPSQGRRCSEKDRLEECSSFHTPGEAKL